MKHLLQCAVVFLLVATAGLPMACAEQVKGAIPLTIETADGKEHIFQVEIANTPENRRKGLMFRDSLAEEDGMLFIHEPPRIASMWMKNTYIPLDMIFIRADGTISSVRANAEPHSLEHIRSQEPVAAVLEIGGGVAGKLGIEKGDVIQW